MFTTIRRFGKRLTGLAIARSLALAGTAVGVRFMTEYVTPSTLGTFRLATGGIALALGLFAEPLNTYSMVQYHRAEARDCTNSFVAGARRAVASRAGLVIGITAAALIPISVVTREIDLALLIAAAATSYVIQANTTFERALLETAGEVGWSGAYNAVEAFGLPLAAVASLWLLGESSSSLIVGQAAFLAITLVLLRMRVPPSHHSVGAGDWLRPSWRFITPLMSVGLLAWLFNVSDRYLLALFRSTSEVGIYSAAYGLAAAPIAAVGSLIPTLAFAPVFRAAAQGHQVRRRELRTRLLLLQAVIVSATTVGIVVLDSTVINLLLGPAFREGAEGIITWVAVGQGLQVLAVVLNVDAYARSRTAWIAASYGFALTAKLVCNIWWIPTLGGLGAARATAVGGLFYFISLLAFTLRKQGFSA